MTNLNANWQPNYDLPDGRFELMVITDDGEHHVLQTSPTTITALTALAQADATLAWDPTNHTPIIATIIGTMPWTQTG